MEAKRQKKGTGLAFSLTAAWLTCLTDLTFSWSVSPSVVDGTQRWPPRLRLKMAKEWNVIQCGTRPRRNMIGEAPSHQATTCLGTRGRGWEDGELRSTVLNTSLEEAIHQGNY